MTNQKSKQKPKQKPKSKPVNEVLYNEYVELKMITLAGGKLKEISLKRIDELEKELKSCSGSRAKMSVRACIGSEICKMIEGIPVPKSIEEAVKAKGREDYYFA